MIECLKLISGNASLAIEPTDGRETVAQATDVFSYIDSNFKHWSCESFPAHRLWSRAKLPASAVGEWSKHRAGVRLTGTLV